MTTWTGKDLTFKINTVTQGYVQEISVEVDNGRQDVREIGTSTIVDFVHGLSDVSGSFTMLYTNYDLLTDVITAGTTKTLALEFGSIPDYTVTMTNVIYGEYTMNLALDEPVSIEVPYNAETLAVT
jgi:hypothetical protein